LSRFSNISRKNSQYRQQGWLKLQNLVTLFLGTSSNGNNNTARLAQCPISSTEADLMEDKHNGPRFEGAQLVAGQKDDATVHDAKYLISILLVYVAKGDGHIDSTETDRMIEIISRRFDSSGAEAMGLLSDAVRTFTDGGDLVGKLGEISLGLTQTECSDIFDMLLEVVMADGELADGEIRTIEAAGMILGLSDEAIQLGVDSAR
jgi:uncharacterized tellurite resistance protein B-like protein